jgi:hypothetical protein
MKRPVPEGRILRLTSDFRGGTLREWRAVARYFRAHYDRVSERLVQVEHALAALNLADDMRKLALQEIAQFVKTVDRK